MRRKEGAKSSKKKQKVPIKERQRRISEGMKLAHKAKKKGKSKAPKKLEPMRVAQIVADIADREAITCKGVAIFPDLLDGTGITVDDITPGVVHTANSINARAVEQIIERVGANRPVQFVEKGSYKDPSRDNSTGEANVSFPSEIERRNEMATKSKKASGTLLRMTRDDVIRLLTELGLKGADSYSDKKLEKKMKELPKVVEASGAELESEESQQFLDEILTQAKQGGSFGIHDKGPSRYAATATKSKTSKSKSAKKSTAKASDGGETKTSKKKAAKKSSAKAKDDAPKKKAAKKSGGGTDEYGSRLGSNNAKINAVLTRKFQPMRDIMDAAGLTGTCYDHLNRMVEKGYVEKGGKDGKEWKLTK